MTCIKPGITVWGVTASPYLLKMQSLLDYSERAWERWPDQAGRIPATAMAIRLQRAKKRGEIARYPAMPSMLDEYPSVPFYTMDGSRLYYDSSALGLHLDALSTGDVPKLVPQDPKVAFVCHLLDEAFDEFGLYMVHHMRWVGSARTTPMGDRTAHEMRSILPPGGKALLARSLYHRQVKRCPYLFSVAPDNFDCGVSARRTPPAHSGFPPTHTLLDDSWRAYLQGMETLLAEQPYLLGEQFTLADASAYGQLSMNLVDGDAATLLQSLAPHTYRWLCSVRDGEHRGSAGSLGLSAQLHPLLDSVQSTFVPLMQQNAQAYEVELARGETLFNEAAFDNHRALYNGQLLGRPFRAVVKTFQVQVWRDLQARWRELSPADREELGANFLAASTAALNSGA